MTQFKYIIVILAITLFPLSSVAADLAAADSAYVKGNYREAESIYQEALAEGNATVGVLYNLGNTYYHLGQEEKAIVYYERALKLAPGDERIKQNLNYLTSRVDDANKANLEGKPGNVEFEQDTFLGGIYRAIAIDKQSNGWAIFAVMAFILFLCFLGMYMFTPNVLARKTGFFGGIAFLGFTVIFLVFAFMGASQFARHDDAVLMEYATELLQKPENNSQPASSPLRKGTKLKIIEVKEQKNGQAWLKVRLNAENIGWVKKEAVEII